SEPDRARGSDPPASELLRAGAERVHEQLADRPAVLAEMLQVIGRTQLERGLIEDARTSLDRALALLDGPARHLHAVREQALADRAMVDYERGSPSSAVERLRALRSEVQDRHGASAPQLNTIELRLADMLAVLGDNDAAASLAASVRQRIETGGDPATD